MRKTKKTQSKIGQIEIEKIELDLKSLGKILKPLLGLKQIFLNNIFSID